MVIGMYEKNAGQSSSGTLIYPLKKHPQTVHAIRCARATIHLVFNYLTVTY